jgi:hypothetical protein
MQAVTLTATAAATPVATAAWAVPEAFSNAFQAGQEQG